MGRQAKKPVVEEKIKKPCSSCKLPKTLDHFYASANKLDSFSKVSICKECIKKNVNVDDINSVHNMLLQLNKPYLHSQWTSSLEESKKMNREPFGIYLKSVFFNYKELTWKNSQFDNNQKDNDTIKSSIAALPSSDNKFNFNVTSEMVVRWGSKHETDDYIKLEDFYHKMKLSNKIETQQEETYLKKLAVISLKMDQELEAGNYGQVKQLGDLFSKYMADSKFRAIDKTEADKTGGIRNFSTIFAEVEKDDHIPPWEYYRKLKNIDQDIVDKTIMHIENFTLRLNKIERMIEPPEDTPELDEDEYDRVDSSV